MAEKQELYESVKKLCENRFSIIFTKNKNLLKSADLILVFKNGAQIEKGSHDELVSNENGIYSTLTKNQSAKYND